MSKIKDVIDYMDSKFVERSEVIRDGFACILSRQHLFMLGVPGTGKSMLVNEYSNRIVGSRFFKKLMTAQTTNEEIFGPLDLQAFKNNQLSFNLNGFAADSEFVFLDETFKANSQTLNSMLTLINERRFDNGTQAVNAPLITLFGASNELPDDASLNALKDRFVCKKIIKPIQNRANLKALLSNDLNIPTQEVNITLQELRDAIIETENVAVDENLIEALIDISEALNSQGITVSARRLGQVLKFLKAHAYINGSSKATQDYIVFAADCLWNSPDDIANVVSTVSKFYTPVLSAAMDILNRNIPLFEALDRATEKSEMVNIHEKLSEERDLLEAKRNRAGFDSPEVIDYVLGRFEKELRRTGAKLVKMRRAERRRR